VKDSLIAASTPVSPTASKEALAFSILQLIVAVAPWVLTGDFYVFLLTVFGLSLTNLMLQLQISTEKSSAGQCSDKKDKFYAILCDGGASYILVLKNTVKSATDLQELATNSAMGYHSLKSNARYTIYGITLGWFLFTILTIALPYNSYYLFYVMVIGTSWSYTIGENLGPNFGGVRYGCQRFVSEPNTMQALQDLEAAFPSYGQGLKEYFPNGPNDAEKELGGAEAKKELAAQDEAKQEQLQTDSSEQEMAQKDQRAVELDSSEEDVKQLNKKLKEDVKEFKKEIKALKEVITLLTE
jgi:hypothetical protein